jgi:hypothetical protein
MGKSGHESRLDECISLSGRVREDGAMKNTSVRSAHLRILRQWGPQQGLRVWAPASYFCAQFLAGVTMIKLFDLAISHFPPL